MMLHKLLKKGVVPVCKQIIKADARADKHLFHLWQRPQLAKKRKVIAVIGDQILAGLRKQALLFRAYALRELLFARRMPERRNTFFTFGRSRSFLKRSM